ncbi:putative phospholipid import ATP-binding protein MlaF [Novipirellula galeiformis]|uniref:Putative phospholipid import ATP-binding protein MlaF n=1 Tax=Novipirellula galeiformis TaxID=2528004 RepID=A0A5C6CR13_9BACT|nr:ABC transporter ATP-binding protein [Novipirellula galeiformis]TWU26798.1 putative phospholipid import ATP-binding protein MlaF [Novipirellula galeiformis]
MNSNNEAEFDDEEELHHHDEMEHGEIEHDDKSNPTEHEQDEVAYAEVEPDDTFTHDSPVLIDVDDLSVVFQGQTILQDIDLSILRGQTIAVIGESGCGKTVFMKTLVGLIAPTHGSVSFDGRRFDQMSMTELTQTRKRFGFVFQNAALFDSMSIFENVAFPLRQNEVVPETEVHERVMQHLFEVGLPSEVARKYPAELSGGMRKRVGLARALILRPELVVYDEPTTGLDPIMSDVINELILETRRRYPVTSIVVTHDMHTARKVADRVLMFYPRRRLGVDESQVLFDGSPSDLEHADDRRVRQFVRGEAGERLKEMSLHSEG